MIPLAIAGLFLGLFTLWVVAPRKFNRGKSGELLPDTLKVLGETIRIHGLVQDSPGCTVAQYRVEGDLDWPAGIWGLFRAATIH